MQVLSHQWVEDLFYTIHFLNNQSLTKHDSYCSSRVVVKLESWIESINDNNYKQASEGKVHVHTYIYTSHYG